MSFCRILEYLSTINDKIEECKLVPLVLIQGFQGCGKTFICEQLQSHYGQEIITISLDDFYYPYDQLTEIKNANKTKLPWYEGRGLPGTHDLDLLQSTLTDLRCRKSHVCVPRFDKSLRDGAGDRIDFSCWPVINASNLKMVVLEGWCLAFQRNDICIINPPSYTVESTDALTRIILQSPFHIIRLEYQGEMSWKKVILNWRWEQELTRHQGLSKESIEKFLERFYLYLEAFEPIEPANLFIKIDDKRKVAINKQ